MLANGVIDHVCKALQNHVTEPKVVEPVLSALYSLCVYHGLRQVISTHCVSTMADLNSFMGINPDAPPKEGHVGHSSNFTTSRRWMLQT